MVKPGYKQTEIGIIPEDWEVATIGDVASFQGGSQPPIQHFVFQEQEGYIRLVQIRDYKTDKYLTYIPISLAKRFCTKDDIMIGRYGPPIFQILRGIEGSYNVALIKATPKDVDKEFLFYILKAETLFEYIDLLSRRSSGQTGVDLDGLREYKIGLPPKSEQICIADALSNMDKLISVIEKQIAKKKGIKQGAMQELLTGKKRLPGFSGEWKSDMLPNILQKDMGIKIGPFGSQLRKEYLLEDGPYRVYGQENVYEHDFTIGTRYLSKERFQQLQSCEICPGDFLISTMGTIGKCAIVPEGLHKGIMDSHLIRLRIDKQKILPEYLLHLFSEELGYLKNQTSKLSVGGIMDGLSTKIVNSLTVYFPVNLVEQQAIAKVLTDLDTEVKALEQKLGKYRQVKQGMMQQLLTGKIRLV